MSKLCPLFSGSSGNSIYISHSGEGILIDAGRSAKQLEKCLIHNQIDIKTIKSIFVTHEHSDHVNGLKVFASRYGIKVYGSKGTIVALEKMGIINGKFPYGIIGEKEIHIENMSISCFKTSHDCSEGLGYIIKFSNGLKAAICTDLGYISDEVKDSLKGCNILAIESNHDIEMLKNGSYPYYLKRRILSEKGHLSNESCAAILPHLVNQGLSRIVLSHLSSENNIPKLAYDYAVTKLCLEGMDINRDFTLFVAPKENFSGEKILF